MQPMMQTNTLIMVLSVAVGVILAEITAANEARLWLSYGIALSLGSLLLLVLRNQVTGVQRISLVVLAGGLLTGILYSVVVNLAAASVRVLWTIRPEMVVVSLIALVGVTAILCFKRLKSRCK
ncbi:hypothetical protein ACQ4M3_29225 [Leptolyngbya sp. AN03gr2]|uniref:hypothetical protein n=1 Tax=unclassified Leptolyngbya TaxID=2650499 RepID=UPI003D31DBE4